MQSVVKPPGGGSKILFIDGEVKAPPKPIIPTIIGDGIGPDIHRPFRKVLDHAVEMAYGGEREIMWLEVPAGTSSFKRFGEYLPKETVDAIKEYLVAIKGPLITPVGGGYRSLNVALRKKLDLYACVRPIKWVQGVPAPMRNPEKLDIVIFRENTEDVYAGMEWKQGSEEAKKVIHFLREEFKYEVGADSGIGVKLISRTATKRLVRAAINYALKNDRKSVTLVHKGNIMKYTEGAFREWGYETAREDFPDDTVIESDLTSGAERGRRIIVKDRIADSMFQQVLLRPKEYDIIATPNLNGDYLSDACAAQVGGLGMAPGANINYETGVALFETTHGAAPKYAGKDASNPGSLILSGVMMLEYIGWREAAELTVKGLEMTVAEKKVTYDLERQMKGAIKLKSSEFGEAIIKNIS